jgi:hypothetical protein
MVPGDHADDTHVPANGSSHQEGVQKFILLEQTTGNISVNKLRDGVF